ncbi:acyl-CoA N-acyltransferase [Aspergillus karnatakaensis]|uniref:N-terminal L-serine N(alpha)-acetyltransferase NAT4 n=1 Tax=Aspergillus karnatakaensis TaxID=1810916 RepID=UPI003CCCC158
MPPIRRTTRKVRMDIKKKLEKPSSDKPISIPKLKAKRKPLPLVERTNALSLEEFVTTYIPTSEIHFQTGGRAPQPQETGDLSADTANQTYTISVYSASTIPDKELDSCLNLIELTSSAAYKASSSGWSPTEKRKEMKLPDMKYMILRRDAESPKSSGVTQNTSGDKSGDKVEEFAGFIEFMVTYEDGYEVLYCYEIHLTPEARGQRLGEELMGRFERIGQRIGLDKAMLTVFKSNSRAITFYKRVGFEEDENSPQPRKLRNGAVKEVDYMIMSKSLR